MSDAKPQVHDHYDVFTRKDIWRQNGIYSLAEGTEKGILTVINKAFKYTRKANYGQRGLLLYKITAVIEIGLWEGMSFEVGFEESEENTVIDETLWDWNGTYGEITHAELKKYLILVK